MATKNVVSNTLPFTIIHPDEFVNGTNGTQKRCFGSVPFTKIQPYFSTEWNKWDSAFHVFVNVTDETRKDGSEHCLIYNEFLILLLKNIFGIKNSSE